MTEPIRLDPLPPHEGPVASVYVHAPFCARRCFYCDFAVQVRSGRVEDGRVEDTQSEGGQVEDAGGARTWARALARELAAVEEEGVFRLADALDTLYVGGGTPSLLGEDAMDRLAGVIGRERLTASGLEWTAEANPESFTPALARAWRGAGVGRVSLGVQSFHEGALSWMGRLHGPEGAERAVRTARDAGFEEISVDLIFGLPGRLGRSWAADLERALRLEPTHVSLYGLTVEGGTPLGRAVAEGRESVAAEERYRTEFLEASRRLTKAGYLHYEVSNFARPGSESRHNRVYWEGGAYLGLGNSSHSYRHPLRRWNLASLDAYREVLRRGDPPVAESEILDARAHRLERVWLGLRTSRGLAAADLDDAALRTVRRWAADGLARLDDDAVRLTPEGWLVMDRLVVELDGALAPPAEKAAGELPGRRVPGVGAHRSRGSGEARRPA